MKTVRNRSKTPGSRIGLFGGTFDPIHKGHLRAAQSVWRGFELSRIYFIPASIPPHKGYQTYAAAHHRLAMIRSAIADNTAFAVSDVEIQRQGPSYSIDTVKAFAKHVEKKARLFFLLGTDAFFEINTWYEFRKIFASVPLIVMLRPEGVDKEYNTITKDVGAYLNQAVSSGYRFDDKVACFTHERMMPVYLYQVDTEDISSTQIRASLRAKKPIGSFVPPAVEEYILKRGLYQ